MAVQVTFPNGGAHAPLIPLTTRSKGAGDSVVNWMGSNPHKVAKFVADWFQIGAILSHDRGCGHFSRSLRQGVGFLSIGSLVFSLKDAITSTRWAKTVQKTGDTVASAGTLINVLGRSWDFPAAVSLGARIGQGAGGFIGGLFGIIDNSLQLKKGKFQAQHFSKPAYADAVYDGHRDAISKEADAARKNAKVNHALKIVSAIIGIALGVLAIISLFFGFMLPGIALLAMSITAIVLHMVAHIHSRNADAHIKTAKQIDAAADPKNPNRFTMATV
ncbi:MAG: hypothetical protein MRY21_03230 [Simkaniaceae bacterium]|nr:hypothetical protein [Simkaniaceae bacterium]